MFQKGVTMSEILDLIDKMYNHHYTSQTISNMTKRCANRSKRSKPAPWKFVTFASIQMRLIFPSNAITCPNKPSILRGGSFERSPGLYSSSHGICIRLKRILQDLKERGVEEMLLFIANGLKGITNRIFPFYECQVSGVLRPFITWHYHEVYSRLQGDL